MGLDIYLDWDGKTEQERESQITGFNNAGQSGYLRSSYNESGFNSWARRHLNEKDLYYVLQAPNGVDSDDFSPDWDKAMERAKEILGLAHAVTEDPDVMIINLHWDAMQDNEASVLSEFKKQHEQHQNITDSFKSYSCLSGYFFLDSPLEVKAILPMRRFGRQSIALVIDSEDKHNYYIEFIEQELMPFIELGNQKPNARIHWSG